MSSKSLKESLKKERKKERNTRLGGSQSGPHTDIYPWEESKALYTRQ
jgi:hypothetical protein